MHDEQYPPSHATILTRADFHTLTRCHASTWYPSNHHPPNTHTHALTFSLHPHPPISFNLSSPAPNQFTKINRTCFSHFSCCLNTRCYLTRDRQICTHTHKNNSVFLNHFRVVYKCLVLKHEPIVLAALEWLYSINDHLQLHPQ